MTLRFESRTLAGRHREFKDAGATWDWPSYKPHVTITYDAGDIDLDKIEPYDGPLEFGPERFAEVDENWTDKISEKRAAIEEHDDMKDLKLFVQLTKVDAKQRIVYGTAVSETTDKVKEAFDYATSKPYFETWSGDIAKATDGKSLGNVRAMHGKVAAGKLTQIGFDDTRKAIDVAAKIVDDDEWEKVEEGVYTGFSIGGRYIKKWKDGEVTRYTADPSEISIVDLPCVSDAQFSMIKADGTTEMRKFHLAATPVVARRRADQRGDCHEGNRACQGRGRRDQVDGSSRGGAHGTHEGHPSGHNREDASARGAEARHAASLR